MEELFGKETYNEIREFPGQAYEHLYDSHRELDQPLALYVFLALIFMTFISFVFRLEGRRRVTGRPLPLGEEGEA